MVKSNKYPKNYIKELRESRGLTLRDLAEKTGWHNQTLSNLELSKADLTWSKIQTLATILECHPSDITDGPGELIAARDEKEKDLLSTFRGLDDSAKQMYLHTLKSFSTVEEPDTAEKDDTKDDKKNVR